MRLHPPGIEPGAPAWKADMLPLHHGCFFYSIMCRDQESNLGFFGHNEMY